MGSVVTEQQKHEAFTVAFYKRDPTFDTSAVRSGHGDAAHMCDAVAADILREHTKRGRPTKLGLELAAAVKRASNAIWRMRDAADPGSAGASADDKPTEAKLSG